MTIPHEDATIYIQGAIDSFGYIQNPKAIEAIRSDIISNYGGTFTLTVLKDVIGRHSNMLVRKAAEPATPPPVVQQNAEAIQAHVADVLKQLSAEFPDVNFYTSQHNNKVLGDYVDSLGTTINMVTLRTGVRLLYNMLEKNPPPEPPAPEPPKEVLRVLSDGTMQLSINATEADLRDPAVTKLALRDYLRRRTNNEKVGGRFYNS